MKAVAAEVVIAAAAVAAALEVVVVAVEVAIVAINQSKEDSIRGLLPALSRQDARLLILGR